MKSQLSLFALLLGIIGGACAGEKKDAPKAEDAKKVEAPAPAEGQKSEEPKAEEKKSEEAKTEEKKEEKGILAKLFSKDDKKEEEKKADEPKADEKKEEEKKSEESAGIALPTEAVSSENVAPVAPQESSEASANSGAPANAEEPKA